MGQERFFAVLKAELSPRLRAAGFSGSGKNFRRLRGEVINAINLQGNRWGGSCRLNLGIHLTFLPRMPGTMPDPRKITEGDCEFRSALPTGTFQDEWWPYGDETISPEESARALIEFYFADGEPHFARFATVPAILASVVKYIAPVMPMGEITYLLTEVRAARAAAYIQRRCGNLPESMRYAQLGVDRINQKPIASMLRAELEALARGDPPPAPGGPGINPSPTASPG